MKWALIILLLAGCGMATLEPTEREECMIGYAQDVLRDHLGYDGDVFDTHRVLIVDDVDSLCGPNTSGCNTMDLRLWIERDHLKLMCASAAHEYLHSISQELHGDWDADHERYRKVYGDYLYQRCGGVYKSCP